MEPLINSITSCSNLKMAPAGSLLNDLAKRYRTNPAAKYTTIGKLDPTGTDVLLPTQVPTSLNLASLLWRIIQLKLFNDLVISHCKALEKTLSKHIETLKNKSSYSMALTAEDVQELNIPIKGQPSFQLVARDNLYEFYDVVAIYTQDNASSTFVIATTRPFQVVTLICSTVPWITLLGSPNAGIKRDIVGYEFYKPETLETSYAVALVDGGETPLSEDSWSPSEIQRQTRDYAFDLVADAGSKPFQDHPGFDGPEKASSTQLKLRALDRSLRAEIRHSVPMELYLIGQMLWHSTKWEPTHNLADSLCQEGNLCATKFPDGSLIVNKFLEQQQEVASLKNGRIPDNLPQDDTSKLIWRSL